MCWSSKKRLFRCHSHSSLQSVYDVSCLSPNISPKVSSETLNPFPGRDKTANMLIPLTIWWIVLHTWAGPAYTNMVSQHRVYDRLNRWTRCTQLHPPVVPAATSSGLNVLDHSVAHLARTAAEPVGVPQKEIPKERRLEQLGGVLGANPPSCIGLEGSCHWFGRRSVQCFLPHCKNMCGFQRALCSTP